MGVLLFVIDICYSIITLGKDATIVGRRRTTKQ